ncbi:hypothetical protein KCP70_17820 [Salmonella enterica subsp. enterica]|nr:hypothetical protein KCP70_17820 [Salmonella enterica subsp. enterica]
MRWRGGYHAGRNRISPFYNFGHFITAAENEGMIIPYSRHLFELIAH